MLPEWLAQPVPVRAAPRQRRSHAVRAFLRHSARFLEEVLFQERAARTDGWLQRLDARAKLLAVLGLLVAASFLHHLLSLGLLAAAATGMLLTSRLRPQVILHHALWLLPGLFMLAALPAVLSVFTPGRPLAVLWRTPEVSITYQGALGAALLISRLTTGVLLALLLSLTTRAQDLFKAAHTSATAPFVYVLSIMHQHFFLLLETAEELHLARRARTLAPPSPEEERRWVGRSLAFLFQRSHQRTEAVYQAMQARGYTGHPRALTASRLRAQEWVWLGLCGALAAGALGLDRLVLGRWLW